MSVDPGRGDVETYHAVIQAASPLHPSVQATSWAAVAVSHDAISRFSRGDDKTRDARLNTKAWERTENFILVECTGFLSVNVMVQVESLEESLYFHSGSFLGVICVEKQSE